MRYDKGIVGSGLMLASVAGLVTVDQGAAFFCFMASMYLGLAVMWIPEKKDNRNEKQGL